MKKVLLVSILTVIIGISIIGLTALTNIDHYPDLTEKKLRIENIYNESTFHIVERVSGTTVIVSDNDTKVMYVYSYYGGFTPLYNADGTLKLYKDERNIDFSRSSE